MEFSLISPVRIFAVAILVFTTSQSFYPARAAESESGVPVLPPAPRIGLALSGGGARGIAHIGVLKVLEELRVPVHCITGTSMGSIVGGGYASGLQAADLEKIVRGTDWNKIFSDRPPRSEISSRRRSEDYKTLFAPEWGLKDGRLDLPKGLLSGVSIEGFLRELTQTAANINDFRDLPIPFQAVAADIETGEPVILAHGSIAKAMRASMAIPGAVNPVEIDGRLLVDGGIANNLPIDLARKLCGDVIIAVNISTPPLTREEIRSALSITEQLFNFLGKSTVDQQLKSLGSSDILITPELGNIAVSSFTRASDAIRIGEEATRAAAAALSRYSLPPEAYAALRAGQTRAHTALGAVDEIRFEGLERTNPEVLRGLVQAKPGEPLTEDKIGADLRRIYGRGDFESVDYRIVEEPGRRVMLIQPREKSWGPDYLRFGLALASDFRGENTFTLAANYRKTWMNSLGGEWLSELQLGRDTRIFSEFYQPVDARGRFFVAPYGAVGQYTRGVFVGDDRLAEYRIREARAGLDAGAVLGTWGELRVGPLWRQVDAKVETGSPLLPDVNTNASGLRARLFIDQQDYPWFPRSGYTAILSAFASQKALGADESYQRLEAQTSAAFSYGRHTVRLTAAGGTDLGSNMPAFEAFSLGGPLFLSGYRIGEFSGQKMTFGRLLYYNRVVALPDLLGTGVYLGASAETGRMKGRFDGLAEQGQLYSASVFVGADTFMGPAYFGVGVAPGGRGSVYLLLGVP